MVEKKLNLGSAGRKKDGYINVDWQSIVTPDVSHDLNVFPYPFSDSEFDVIEASHIIEHLDRPFDVMKEIYRILKPGGLLVVKVPHFSRGMAHPEHAHGFDVTFPNYFNSQYSDVGYFGIDFEILVVEMHWLAFPHILKRMGYSNLYLVLIKSINRIINFFASLSTHLCSRVWCFWVGGFDEIEFQFRSKKNEA
jgi:SAM-dependent methyltransferase